MAAYETRDESKHWRLVTLPAKTNRGEMYKALHFADQEYERLHGQPADADTSYEVEGDGEEIIIRIEKPKEKS
jgi:hypothetical protein